MSYATPLTGNPAVLNWLIAVLWVISCLSSSGQALASFDNNTGMEALIQKKIAAELQEYFSDVPTIHQQYQFAKALNELYKTRDYHLIWSNSALCNSLIELLKQAVDEGLNPQHYSIDQLTQLFAKKNVSRITQVRMDLLASESLMRLLAHLYYGKVDPLTFHPLFNAKYAEQLVNLVPQINRAIATKQLANLIAAATPSHPDYVSLKNQLKWLRQLAKEGDWPVINYEKLIRPGETADTISQIRQRLLPDHPGQFVTADSQPGTPAENNFYDPQLVEQVKQFQLLHQLQGDGVIGRKTVAAMNIPLTEKISTLRANLERLRWLFRDLGKDYILVDIAEFEIHLYQNSKRVWTARAQVGKPWRETPVFRSQIEYLEWNPDWTVPPTVIKEDLLPQLVGNPGYLTKHNFQLLDHNNQPLKLAAVSWDRLSASYIPFKLRQPPGPRNALGRVKFIFPNPYYVYLHDTPSKNLFNSETRAFSSGCIRIEKPYELAEILLNEKNSTLQTGSSTHRQIEKILLSNTSERQYLPVPVPILLIYRTAQVTEKGHLKFSPDIYHRDKPLLLALDQQKTAFQGE
jgi:L,D-transpeptidase YcbB